jgi:P2-related tail formation protein
LKPHHLFARQDCPDRRDGDVGRRTSCPSFVSAVFPCVRLDQKGVRLQEYKVTLRSLRGHAENVTDARREAFQDSLEDQASTFNTYLIGTDNATGQTEVVLWVDSYSLVSARRAAYNVFLRAQKTAWQGAKTEMPYETITAELADSRHLDENDTFEDSSLLEESV